MTLLLPYAMSFVGTPYKWGGSNPMEGFDCSGYIQWVLKSAGMDPPGDQTAQGLYDHFEKTGAHNSYTPGALVFYGESVKKIYHVALVVDPYRMLEAGGGNHLTMTFADACAKGACVRMSLIKSRNDLVAVIKPRYAAIGIP